jgi:hypothetical protein
MVSPLDRIEIELRFTDCKKEKMMQVIIIVLVTGLKTHSKKMNCVLIVFLGACLVCYAEIKRNRDWEGMREGAQGLKLVDPS